MDDQNKNLILAVVLSAIVLVIWQVFFPPVEPVAPSGNENAVEITENLAATPAPVSLSDAQSQTTLDNTVQAAQRITIDTDRLEGSISLLGGRIDDLLLKDYKEELGGEELVTLLQPVNSDAPYYAVYGWAPGGTLTQNQVPGPNTIWQVESGSELTVSSPVTLVWNNQAGLIFRRMIEIDENYLFSVTQSVENTTGQAHRMFPYGIIARHGEPDVSRLFVLHEGLVGLADGELYEDDYDGVSDYDVDPNEGVSAEIKDVTENGWIGFTDKYWMTALAPKSGQAFKTVAKHSAGADIYQVETRLPTQTVEAGATVSKTTNLFAGAKEWEVIKTYEEENGIDRFVDSIDWGWFFFITKPIFKILHSLNIYVGNMGWSIIALTLLIKGIMLPLAYKSYVSMARMKELQPEMQKIKEAAGDDRQKMQKDMMALYRTHKVNPASGCLPLLLQIPVFFSLYKVIIVTIELRHAPWWGWIQDLSAPDPSTILNLFGILPFTAPDLGVLQFLSLGILPIFLGVSMWLQQKLNPKPTDPTQAMVMAWMPWVFMFMLGTFASGLVLYWIANNVITFIQQYTIMRMNGHKPEVLGNILRSFRKEKKDEASS